MKSAILIEENDIQPVREFIARLAARSTIVDVEEQLLLAAVRPNMRVWRQDTRVVGFAFVDEYNNLWFDAEPEFALQDALESEMIDWGVFCIQRSLPTGDTRSTLDSTCSADNHQRIRLLEKHGFAREAVRSLQFTRSLDAEITPYFFPAGFSARCVNGRQEVEALVALHLAAFGTENMSVEYRLAMMSTPQYDPALDLVAVAPDHSLAAFCVCGLEDADEKMGYTDPVGTHPAYQRLGLGKALISVGLTALKNAGARSARLGTSSGNIAMQQLAKAAGFVCTAEKLWFSKPVARLP